jgi:hypothetical protein
MSPNLESLYRPLWLTCCRYRPRRSCPAAAATLSDEEVVARDGERCDRIVERFFAALPGEIVSVPAEG